MTYGWKKASFARQSCPGRTGEIWAGRLLRASKKHFIFAAEKMKNSLLTL